MTQAVERYRVPIVGALLMLLCLAAVVIYVRRPASRAVEIVEPSSSAIPTPGQLAVYVTGAVVEPGVCYLPEGSRVEDVLLVAGGAKPEADLNRVNLARRVHDEEQIYVPEVGEELLPVKPGGSAQGDLMNINTASARELEALTGIGPTLAERIVDYRQAHGPFAAIDDIMGVRGIGEGLFDEIKDLITVG